MLGSGLTDSKWALKYIFHGNVGRVGGSVNRQQGRAGGAIGVQDQFL